MPVPTHFKFTVRGQFVGSPEEWSYGFKMTRTNSLPTADAGLDDINEANVTAAILAFHATAFFAEVVQPTDWRAYVIGSDGKMEGNGPLLHEIVAPAGKGTGVNQLKPPQIATVVTLVADDRGPAKLGRFYLPASNKTLGSDLRLSVGDATALAVSVTTMLKAVSDAIDLEDLTSSNGCNVSPGPAGSSTGTLQPIDHVEVGRVYDTVRNRRKSILEERYVHTQIDW